MKIDKNWITLHKGMDHKSIRLSMLNHLEYSLASDYYTARKHDLFTALAMAVRDRVVERWINTQQTYYARNSKRLYYLSLEFLIGRTLGNSLYNLGIFDICRQMLEDLGYDLEELREQETDSGLGNGGLGRLAACFMDSLSTLQLPAYGYGIRYEYGLFQQKIINGFQVEEPDHWLSLGNPWEFPRPQKLFKIRFYGSTNHIKNNEGQTTKVEWINTQNILAMPYDLLVPGFGNQTVNTIRLWSAKSMEEFDLDYFNDGDYIKACESKALSENISKVLYPRDDKNQGKELRLKQQYFFVSASIQDILRRHYKIYNTYDNLPDKVAIQLNDTHPAIAIPELMRILIDEKDLIWDQAWEITKNVFGYTNHTLMSEALERWPVSLIKHLLPRHMEIIYDINANFLREVANNYPRDRDRLSRMSIIEEGGNPAVRMAHLAIVGSHSTNGVAELHTELLKTSTFKDFNDFFPKRFNCKTNGITQRRWLLKCNPGLSGLINKHIGNGWVRDLAKLEQLKSLANNAEFREEWKKKKLQNKQILYRYIKDKNNIKVDINSIFDTQVKRIHEYKRQHLNVLHIISLYNEIKLNPNMDFAPRTFIFAGKAAPGYFIAKLIIKLINSVAKVINNDKTIKNLIKVVFLANYGVSLAEKIIPAADISEQISTAGTEASGTGNMKFALNGALTIGTLDGANVEILNEVGEENIFIFGLTNDKITELKPHYNPRDYYEKSKKIKDAIELISNGFFSPETPDLFKPVVDSLLNHDPFLALADFESYSECQKQVSDNYLNPDSWWKKSILNVANMGKFSSDRTIKQYAEEIWNLKPVPVSFSKP
ncbi:MAG: glycogen/starch/alpha-glucan phosphorylase [bacterium]